MADANPYTKFLLLPENLSHPNHYELLGLPLFSDDPQEIRKAAAGQNQKLMRWQNADQVYGQVKKVQAEVATAMVVLLSPEKKSEYDTLLKRKTEKRSQPPQAKRGRLPSNPTVRTEEIEDTDDFRGENLRRRLPGRVRLKPKSQRTTNRAKRKQKPNSRVRQFLYESSIFGFVPIRLLQWSCGMLVAGTLLYFVVPGTGAGAYYKTSRYGNAPSGLGLMGTWDEGIAVHIHLPNGKVISRKIVTRRVTGNGKSSRSELWNSDSAEGVVEVDGTKQQYKIQWRRNSGVEVAVDGRSVPKSWFPW